VLALVCHALLIYALGFESRCPLPTSLPALEVLVLRPSDAMVAASPRQAEAPAGRSQAASWDLAASSETEPSQAPSKTQVPPDATPESPEPEKAEAPPPNATPAAHQSASPTETTAPTEMEVHSSPDTSISVPADPTLAAADSRRALASPPGTAPPLSAATILASRGEEIARLNAKLAEDTTAYSNRPRRKAISASTQEYKYASYLEAWRRKVEAIGNLNYPEEARRRKLYGNLILQVGVRADGSLEEVRVLRSSGSTLLDEAAVRIVHLAAPFAPFPPDIRQETDFLDITRTWQFLSNNRFGGKP